MHELSVAEQLLEQLDGIAQETAAVRIEAIVLEVGALSCVSAEALQFCFEAISPATVAAGARLQIEMAAGLGRCDHCGREFPLETLYDPCPHCGAFGSTVIAGRDVRLLRVEVSDVR